MEWGDECKVWVGVGWGDEGRVGLGVGSVLGLMGGGGPLPGLRDFSYFRSFNLLLPACGSLSPPPLSFLFTSVFVRLLSFFF